MVLNAPTLSLSGHYYRAVPQGVDQDARKAPSLISDRPHLEAILGTQAASLEVGEGCVTPTIYYPSLSRSWPTSRMRELKAQPLLRPPPPATATYLAPQDDSCQQPARLPPTWLR